MLDTFVTSLRFGSIPAVLKIGLPSSAMASFVRLGHSPILQRIITSQQSKALIRTISTSGKKRETATIAEPVEKCKSESVAVKKNWVSYGFDFKNETDDINAMNATFFFSVTLCLVIGGFLWAYLPDYGMRDWSQREGYLVLRRREQQGLAAIDANLISAEKIVLPTDEELGDLDIVI